MIRNHLALVSAALAAIVAAALLLPAGEAQAHDQDTYRFRLANEVSFSAHIRCGTSGEWTSVSGGSTANLTCSGSTAQYRYPDTSATNETWDCTSDQPIRRIRLVSDGLAKLGAIAESSCVS